MGTKRVKYSAEFKDEAVRMVIDGSRRSLTLPES